MDMIKCQVTTFYQMGSKLPDSMTETEIIWLPKTWEGKLSMNEPVMDLSLNGKLIVSSNYQSVHYGAVITVRNVPTDQSDPYLETLQAQLKERISLLKPEADILLDELLEDSNRR